MEIKTISKQYIVDEVYQQIVEKIKKGTWEPGEKLPSENQLCQMFGVSRTSIRSALQKVSAYGIIEIRHGQGSFVLDHPTVDVLDGIQLGLNMTDKEILDMLEFRETIEFKCIDLAVERATEEDVQSLEQALNKMIENKDDYKNYSLADFEFHLVFAKASKNNVLYNVMKNTKAFYYYLEELNRVFGVNSDTLEGHQRQFHFFKNRDAEGIKDELRRGMEEMYQIHKKNSQ
ncbi:FadR/GntR family transcriptional regulator [Neobacillus niacini]|uniref:FadR/GntR family transcriptional regulator n=1 Tax=Neobacillus niacini TaxID=86668 RepID=UPI003001C10E